MVVQCKYSDLWEYSVLSQTKKLPFDVIEYILEYIYEFIEEEDPYFERGRVHYIKRFGLKEGMYSEKYRNGSLKYSIEYKQGKLDGMYEEYYATGNIKSRDEFHNNERHGLRFQYYNDDNHLIYSLMNYRKGKKHGIYYEWFFTHDKIPSLRYYIQYRNGKIHGKFIQWNEEFQLKKYWKFLNGKKEGLQKTFHETNRIYIEEHYENDKLHGKRIEYNSDHSYKIVSYYQKGRLHGPYQTLSKENIIVQCIYQDGKLEGLFQEYYEIKPQQIKKSFHYRHNVLYGECKEYDENGMILLDMNYD